MKVIRIPGLTLSRRLRPGGLVAKPVGAERRDGAGSGPSHPGNPNSGTDPNGTY
jgi:hypothetical protein